MNSAYRGVLNRLLFYRMSLRLTQKDMADIMKITQSHYSKIEAGLTSFSAKYMQRMMEHHLDVDYLITGKKTEDSILNILIEKCSAQGQAKFLELINWVLELEIESSRRKDIIVPRGIYYKSEILRLKSCTQKNIWKIIREVNRLTQVNMADGLKLTLSRYRQLEKDISLADAEILMQLYEFLQYPPSIVISEKCYCLTPLNEIWRQIDSFSKKEIADYLKLSIEFINRKYGEECFSH